MSTVVVVPVQWGGGEGAEKKTSLEVNGWMGMIPGDFIKIFKKFANK